MKYNRVRAIAWKEALQIRRDLRSILIVVAMPVILMLAFGYGVSFDIKHLPTYVFDRENSQQSRELVQRFRGSEYFNVRKQVDNYRDLVKAIDAGDCQLAIVIPPQFSEKMREGGPVSVQALVDGTDGNSANVGMGYADAVVLGYSQQIQLDWVRQRGQRAMDPPIAVAARTWFNEDLESMANIVPGVVAIVMAVVGTFLTSLTIAREWERGTMEQLISTPVSPLELMVGKLSPYLVIGLADTALCAGIGVWWFGVPFRGSLAVLFISSTLFLCVVLSLGYFLSVALKSQLAASQASMIATFLPAFLLSGFIFPIDQMPAFIQVVTHFIPARYFMSIIRAVFLKGTPLVLLWEDLLALFLFASVLIVVATRAFQKRLR
ncbi:MAG TPA: ABC transporter permease [Candidatus Saccharimonadales bacterium]|nr:ABC transporter permease [Candidatus Saccharimonadales bacterium]